MRSHDGEEKASCLSEYVIEEHALARLPDESAHEVEKHLSACEACAVRFEKARSEAGIVRGILLDVAEAPEGPCVEDADLAMYLDGALSAEERAEVQSHLSRCRRCQAELVSLFHEIHRVLHDDSSVPETEEEMEPDEKHTLSPVRGDDQTKAVSATVGRQVGSRLGRKHVWEAVAAIMLAAGIGFFVPRANRSAALQAVGFAALSVVLAEWWAARVGRSLEKAGPRGIGWRVAYWMAGVLAVFFFLASLLWDSAMGWCLWAAAVCWWGWLLGRIGERFAERFGNRARASKEGEESHGGKDFLDLKVDKQRKQRL